MEMCHAVSTHVFKMDDLSGSSKKNKIDKIIKLGTSKIQRVNGSKH